jgi:hypothetical protein
MKTSGMFSQISSKLHTHRLTEDLETAQGTKRRISFFGIK